jgi:hypothetical protein
MKEFEVRETMMRVADFGGYPKVCKIHAICHFNPRSESNERIRTALLQRLQERKHTFPSLECELEIVIDKDNPSYCFTAVIKPRAPIGDLAGAWSVSQKAVEEFGDFFSDRLNSIFQLRDNLKFLEALEKVTA